MCVGVLCVWVGEHAASGLMWTGLVCVYVCVCVRRLEKQMEAKSSEAEEVRGSPHTRGRARAFARRGVGGYCVSAAAVVVLRLLRLPCAL